MNIIVCVCERERERERERDGFVIVLEGQIRPMEPKQSISLLCI